MYLCIDAVVCFAFPEVIVMDDQMKDISSVEKRNYGLEQC